MKVKDLTNRQINKICLKQQNCDKCPLKRLSDDGRRLLLCYKKCRALFIANKLWHEQIMKCEDMTEHDREYHEAMWQDEIENQLKLEENEVEIKEEDYK